MRDGFGETEAYGKTTEGEGLASTEAKLTEKRRKGTLAKRKLADDGE